jgi:cold shock CspA family protein
MYVGTICKVVVDRGYAFIKLPGSADIFCHAQQLRDLDFDEQLTERRVRFETETDYRTGKLRAKNVFAAVD